MNLTIETVGKGMAMMARYLKNAPEITSQTILDWHLIFNNQCSDEAFRVLASQACASLTWFPAPGEFRAIVESNIEERAELAWHYAKLAVKNAGPLGVDAKDVGGDKAAVWAISAVGASKMQCLFHTSQPPNHEVYTRAAFVRAYKTASRFGLVMERVVSGEPQLPTMSPALSLLRELEQADNDVLPPYYPELGEHYE